MTSPSSSDPAVSSGDLVRLDFELWAESGDKSDLVDTTRESVAQEAKLDIPAGFQWGPRAHLIGGEYFPTGIENALVGLSVGKETEKEFAPADAFGEKDPKLIELFSMHEIERLPEMRREDAHLDVGTVLTIRGRRGRVVSLTAARVRVDFNPAYAGRKVRGKFVVTEKIATPVDQVRALLDLTYGHGADFGVEVHQGTVTLKVPDRSKFDLSWAASKPRVIDRIRLQLKPKTIQIMEEFVTPAAKTEEKPAADAGAAPPAASKGPSSKAHGGAAKDSAHPPAAKEAKSD
ncbi:MAG TPA: hypothetical protein VEY07_05275 [Thermoplasmata archaeon]|nr:hypothetical protein [Thermoplasmata archaeon]